MFTTSWLLLLFAVSGQDIGMLPDEHSPFATESECDIHALETAIPELAGTLERNTAFRYVCLPITLESI